MAEGPRAWDGIQRIGYEGRARREGERRGPPRPEYARFIKIAIVVGGVAAIVAVVLVVGFYPLDPLRDVSFTTNRSEHAIGETVGFSLFNGGEITFSFRHWTVERLVAGVWKGVECHLSPLVEIGLFPDELMAWTWTIKNANPENCPLASSVEAGSYRGVVILGEGEDVVVNHRLYAEFVVV